MRQVLLAIMLVGAAFAGGAAVNGPGLRWVRDNVFKKLADDGDAPVPEVSGPSGSSDPGLPSAPVPTVVSEAPPKEKAKDDARVVPKDDPAPSADLKAEAPLAAPAASKPSSELALASAPESLAAVPPLEAPDDAEAPRKDGEKAAAKDEDQAPKAQPAPDQTASTWPDMPGSPPAAAVLPKPIRKAGAQDAAVASTTFPAANSGSPNGGDWAELRRKMSAMGIARYGFEGEPNGRVRFHCVIPLAGRRAVGQQFEAEGDDEFDAARIALRRVALWQATETPAAAAQP